MPPQRILVSLAIVLSACAQSSTTSATGTASTPSASPAAANPCAVAGTCTVDVVIPDDVVGALQRSGMSVKIFDGCPRTLGFRDNSTGASPMINDNMLSVRTTGSMSGAAPV